MADFKSLIKERRQAGQGILSSLASSVASTTLEKIDPRNIIFKKGTVLGSLFPNVKGYKATQEKIKSPKEEPSVLNREISEKLTTLSQKLDFVGKNTMALPVMMRDINVMRQSMVKLVKLSGGTQRDRADRFFQSALERENIYESKFAERKTTPERIGEKTEDNKGFMSSMLGFLTGFLGEGIISKILKGGLLVGGLAVLGQGIREFFSNEAFRTEVIEKIGEAFSKTFQFLTETEAGKNILVGLSAVGAALLAFKGTVFAIQKAFAALSAFIFKSIRSGGALATKPGKTTIGKGKLGIIASVLGAIGLGVYALSGNEEDIKLEDDSDLEGIPTESNFGVDEGLAAAGSAALAYGAYKAMTPEEEVVQKDKTGRYRDPKTGRFTKAPAVENTKWTRFLAFLEKRSPKLFQVVGKRLAVLGAGFVVPGVGWLMSLITILGSVSLAWEVYNLWKEFSNQDAENKTPDSVDQFSTEFPNENLAPTPTNDVLQDVESKTPSQMENSSEPPYVAPSPVPMSNMGSLKTTSLTNSDSMSGREGTGDDLLSYIKQKEGFTAKAKWDYKQFSIGYGTKAKSPNEVISEEEAEKRLKEKIDDVQKYVIDYGRKYGYNWNKKQIDALTSFSYNVGSLDQLTKKGTRTNEEIAEAMPLYSKAGGKTLPGLLKRRTEEVAMFTSQPLPTQIAGSGRVPGSQIASSSTELNSAMRIGPPEIIVNAPQTNVQQASQTPMVQGPTPNVVDREFMKILVTRTI